jgi:hypothetical protein
VAGALQADKLGNVLEVLAENVLVASREHGYGPYAEFEQLLFSRRIVHHVNRDEVNAFLRKKLFRPQATASTRLGEQDQFVSDVFHGRIAVTNHQTDANLSAAGIGFKLKFSLLRRSLGVWCYLALVAPSVVTLK